MYDRETLCDYKAACFSEQYLVCVVKFGKCEYYVWEVKKCPAEIFQGN